MGVNCANGEIYQHVLAYNPFPILPSLTSGSASSLVVVARNVLARLLRKRRPRAAADAALGPEGATDAFALLRVQVPGLGPWNENVPVVGTLNARGGQGGT